VDDGGIRRRFNRSFTQRIGVLGDSYLDAGRPLGPSRLLFEVGDRGAHVSELRRRLGLDSGYVSRLLRQLEDEHLVTVTTDPADRRQRVVTLSPLGRREWRRLDGRAQRAARRLVQGLAAPERARLADALATADRLLGAAAIVVDEVAPDSAVAHAALDRYFAELDSRFRSGFDPGAAGDDVDMMRAPHGTFLVLRDDDSIVGCAGLHRIDDVTGEVKRMWVDPDWRGLGLGGRLLAAVEDRAQALGCITVVLDTNESLDEAIAMYERAGYSRIDRYNDNPYAHHWFSKVLRSPDPPD
jgi:DNA-binding MarR family transcriptional regulator/ribosomal protein S18 acetylase RimI-like enzyme